MVNQRKIIFFGTPVFAAIILETLAKSEFKPIAVVTEPDKPVGRKQILTPPPVKETALKYNTPVFQPEKIENCKLKIENLNPDLIAVAAYGKILPKEILDIPRFGSLNIHPSLLPKYRGASPIQTTILNGDKETGVTIILMDEKVDHGPIITNGQKLITNNKITTEELSEELAELGAELLIKTLPKWLAGEIRPIPQDDSQATFTHQIKKEDGKIDWQKAAEEIERIVRAYWPWPTAFAEINPPAGGQKSPDHSRDQPLAEKIKNKILKIIEAEVLEIQHNKTPGTVFLTKNKELTVACGINALILKVIQLEGKKQMTVREFLNGRPEIIGSQLA